MKQAVLLHVEANFPAGIIFYFVRLLRISSVSSVQFSLSSSSGIFSVADKEPLFSAGVLFLFSLAVQPDANIENARAVLIKPLIFSLLFILFTVI